MYNLEKKSSDYTELFNLSVEKLYSRNYIFVYQKLFDFRISYLAPAYHFNNFENIINKYFENDIPKMISKGVVDETDMSFSTLKVQLELNTLLISIKTSLDRLVFFISKINKGVSPSSTFGRIRVDGKGKGMMSEVLKQKDNNKLMRLIYDNYNDWIYKAVKPRDTVIHYENLQMGFQINDLNKFNPVFSKFEREIEDFDLDDLKLFVDKWMIFCNNFLKEFSKSI